MIVNLFEIKIEPQVLKLYASDVTSSLTSQFNDVSVKVSKEISVSTQPRHQSRPIVTGIEEYTLWLIREFFFKQVEKSELFFSLNRREGSFAILDEKLHRDQNVSILRKLIVRFHHLNDKYYLSVLPLSGLHNRMVLSKLLLQANFKPDFFLKNNKALIYIEKDGHRGWYSGFIKAFVDNNVKVEVPSLFNGTLSVETKRVIPTLRKSDYIFDRNYYQEISQVSQRLGKVTAKDLLYEINRLTATYIKPIFNIPFGEHKLSLAENFLDVDKFSRQDISALDSRLNYNFKRDSEFFSDTSRFKGLSKLNVSSRVSDQNVILFATKNTIGIIENMVESLNNGVMKDTYKFDMPSKFGIRLKVVDKFIVDDFRHYLDECKKIIYSTEDKHKNALVIAYLPENSDIYYEFKAKLAAYGKVSQIRSKSTLDIYTAWNIATNIYAKTGHSPWTISDNSSTDHADLILGFSYSTLNLEGRLRRNIGYVNVFDKNGEWKYMRSHPGILDFNNREKIIPQLVQEALYAYMAGGTSPKVIDIHYSKRFSKTERKNVFEAINKILPTIQKVNFVSIDDSHSLRVFDLASSNAILKRGEVVFLRESEFLLSVLGSQTNDNSYRQLKVIIHTEGERSSFQNNVAVAQRILALTKLNWRSAVRDSSEPVTLKYSHEIAKLTNHFSLTEWNSVATNLSNIPWFI